MPLSGFVDWNQELGIPYGDGSTFPFKQDNLDPLLRMALLNPRFTSSTIHSILRGKSSASRHSTSHDAALFLSGGNFQAHVNTSMQPYFKLPSPMSFSSINSTHSSSTAQHFPRICQGAQKGNKRRYMEETTKSDSQSSRNLHPVSIKPEPGTQVPKKLRSDASQENIQDLLLNECQDENLQIKRLIQQHRELNHLYHPILRSVPQLRGLHLQLPEKQLSLLQDQSNQQILFQPSLDGPICCRRFTQYLYHLRNRPRDNNIIYWKKFVSEYYAPGSKQRWCFSTYDKIELCAPGVFCPKSQETWCCDICGSRSGRGLEATCETFPRLFKTKFESGMLDEILYIDFPRACKLPSGSLMLEYGKAIQESVYEKFRVVHEGKLRITFGYGLKILSMEFCAQKHEEYLLRRLIAPQVNELLQVAKKYVNDIPDSPPVRVSSEDMQVNCNRFVSAGHKVAREMELPLVNELGYPKRFVRCLQIAQVVNCMKDLMTFSHTTKLGPIESLNTYSMGSKIDDHTKEDFDGPQNLQTTSEEQGTQNLQTTSEGPPPSSSFTSRFESSELSKSTRKAMLDKLLHNIREKTPQDTTYERPSIYNRGPTTNLTTGNEQSGEKDGSESASSSITEKLPTQGNSPAGVTVKTEPCSPEAYRRFADGLPEIEDLEW